MNQRFDEDQRVEDLFSYAILDSAPEEEFSDLAELATQICGCAMAAISFIDRSRQWFKAEKGMGLSEIQRDLTFCSRTIQQTEPLIVEDARLDTRFANFPFVKKDPGIRFYAGVPIVSEAGFNVGTVCILDQQSLSMKADQIKALQMISRQVSKLLELRQKNAALKAAADAKIQLQKSFMQQTLLVQEEEKFYVSTELHENIAQGLAAAKLYLELAGDGTDLVYMNRCKTQVDNLINQTRSLSKKLFPSTLTNTPVTDLIKPLLEPFKQQRQCKVLFDCTQTDHLPFAYTTLLYLMAGEFIKNYEPQTTAQIRIAITVLDDIEMVMEADGKKETVQDFENGYQHNKMVLLVEFYNGTIITKKNDDTACLLQVNIPLPQ